VPAIPTRTTGVGDRSDLQTGLHFYYLWGTYGLEITPGVFFREGVRCVLPSQGWSQSWSGSTDWNTCLRSYRLDRPVSSPIRVERVQILVGSQWKDLLPVYSAVVLRYTPHWIQRWDGLWEAPIQLVLPYRVYDSEGNGYYRVDDTSEISDYGYFIDPSRQVLISKKPGLLWDGFRTSPTVEIYERVRPERDGTIQSRWKPAKDSLGNPAWCYFITDDGQAYRPDRVEDYTWYFPVRLPPHSGVLRYYVLNSYCLFGDVLEVFTEPCQQLRVYYDAAETDDPLEFPRYPIKRRLWGERVTCVVPSGTHYLSAPSATGVLPNSIEPLVFHESVSVVPGSQLWIGCRVLDANGRGVPNVEVVTSVSTSGCTVLTPTTNTDASGFASVKIQVNSVDGMIDVEFHSPSYTLSATASLGPVRTVSVPMGHQIVYERRSLLDKEYDELVLFIVDGSNIPITEGQVTVSVLGSGGMRLEEQEAWSSKVTVKEDGFADMGTLILQITKAPMDILVEVTSNELWQCSSQQRFGGV